MNFVLPIRPSKSSRAPKTPKASKTTKTLQPPPESPRRRPSLATRGGIVKRRSDVITTFNAPSISFFEAMFGDDFPDAFANGDGRSCKSRKTLLDLPSEVLEIVCRPLSKMDIKRLRLTSRELAELVELRIGRVYISPNRANLDCLNRVLNHPRYSMQVQEIVWDDAQLDGYPTLQHFCQALDWDCRNARIVLEDHLSTLIRSGYDSDSDYERISVDDCVREDGVPTDIGKAILLSANDRKSRDIIASYAATMSVEDSYSLYQKLYQDETEIMKRGWDVSGLQQALAGFPNLERITLTSEIWRPWNPIPMYDTPFFRALPIGFRKPSVWPWVDRRHYPLPVAGLRDEHDWIVHAPIQRLPKEWRGYSIVMASMVACPVPQLQEIVIDSGHEMVGLPHELFSIPNIDYDNTLRVLNITLLKKLQLSLIAHGHISYQMDLLKHVIGAAPHLEHLDVSFCTVEASEKAQLPFENGFFERNCRRLRHIALRHISVNVDWLFDVITCLSELNTVVLHLIKVIGPEGIHETQIRALFFSRLRDHFTAASLRGPNITWIQNLPSLPGDIVNAFRFQVLDSELNTFLYDDGESPFNTTNEPIGEGDEAYKPGYGWIMDGRDPMFRQTMRETGKWLITTPRNPWLSNGERISCR